MKKDMAEVPLDSYKEDIGNLLQLFITDDDERAWALEEITQNGPPHKRLLSALLLTKAYNLIKKTEQQTGSKFAPLTGVQVINDKYEDEYIMPAHLLLNDEEGNGKSEAELVAKAPDHESLTYLFAMQAMDWASKQK